MGSSVQLLSHVRLFETPWTAAPQAFLSFPISSNLLKPMSIELVMPCNHLILCHPLLLLRSIFSSIRVFSSESALHIRWPKYWSFSLSISPSNEFSGLISFGIDWFDVLAVQGTRISLLQHCGQKHQFFSAQPSLWSSSHIHTWLLGKPYRIVNYRRYAEEQIPKTYSSENHIVLLTIGAMLKSRSLKPIHLKTISYC